jgi:hypothetical protein
LENRGADLHCLRAASGSSRSQAVREWIGARSFTGQVHTVRRSKKRKENTVGIINVAPFTPSPVLPQSPVGPRLIPGRIFDKRSWAPTPIEAALMAVKLMNGAVGVERFLQSQACWLTGAYPAHVAIINKLPSADREAAARALTIANYADREQCWATVETNGS